MNGHAVFATPKPMTPPGRKPLRRPAKPMLSADQSAVVRDRLQTEVAALRTAEDLVAWATSVLPTKNSLQAADAQALEEAFEAKRRALEAQEPPAEIAPIASERTDVQRPWIRPQRLPEPLAVRFPKTRRRRDKVHLQYVASKPYLVCGAHLAMPTTSALLNKERSAARSATSSQCPYAALIIGRYTIEATRGRGGRT